jgi:pimeloyl-ACP methyl ester carboxylesterase
MNCWRVGNHPIIMAFIFWMPCLGCARMMNFHSEERQQHGFTLVLPGIESAHLGHLGFVSGLKSGGVASEVEIVDWTTGTPALMLMHLRHESRNRQQAAQIAGRIVEYQSEHPGRPVNLIGHSGGGALALMVVEALPPNQAVDCVVLLAAAISPEYDLRPVLAKTRRGVWNYSSRAGDSLLLVAGTSAFGTVDGRYSPSAGAVGFQLPADATDADRQQYCAKLIERPYEARMVLRGNLSGHYGPMNPLFARRELAPIICGSEHP